MHSPPACPRCGASGADVTLVSTPAYLARGRLLPLPQGTVTFVAYQCKCGRGFEADISQAQARQAVPAMR